MKLKNGLASLLGSVNSVKIIDIIKNTFECNVYCTLHPVPLTNNARMVGDASALRGTQDFERSDQRLLF